MVLQYLHYQRCTYMWNCWLHQMRTFSIKDVHGQRIPSWEIDHSIFSSFFPVIPDSSRNDLVHCPIVSLLASLQWAFRSLFAIPLPGSVKPVPIAARFTLNREDLALFDANISMISLKLVNETFEIAFTCFSVHGTFRTSSVCPHHGSLHPHKNTSGIMKSESDHDPCLRKWLLAPEPASIL